MESSHRGLRRVAALALEVVASKSETQGHLSGCGEQYSRTWSSFHLTCGTVNNLNFYGLFCFLSLKKRNWEPIIPTRGRSRMPAFEKCESKVFRPSSCGKLFTTVSHPPHSVWREIQWHTLKSSPFRLRLLDFDFEKSFRFVRQFSLIWRSNRWNPT